MYFLFFFKIDKKLCLYSIGSKYFADTTLLFIFSHKKMPIFAYRRAKLRKGRDLHPLL